MCKATPLILSFLFLTQSYLLGQGANAKTEAIDIYTYQLDTTTSNTVDTISFLIDSVQVTARVYKNKVVTTCSFERSKSMLTIHFYLRDKDLVSVKVKEQSPKMDDMFANSFFYYDKGKLLDENYYSTVRPCMAIPLDKNVYELYGYNPNLNASFLKKFVLLLYDKIKLQPTIGLLPAADTLRQSNFYPSPPSTMLYHSSVKPQSRIR